MMRRLLFGLVVGLIALPAGALAGDLDDMMEDDGGDFAGVGVVMCSWGEDTAAATYEIVRSHGMSMVHGPEGDLMLSGALTASWSETGSHALELGAWSEWEMSGRYAVTERSVERLGRPATEATIREGDLVRARVVFDDASTVPLLTEVFGADGVLFRTAALVEFRPEAPEVAMPDDMPEHDMLMPTDPSRWLPASTTGYRRVDSYEMRGTHQAYYSDGLFSYSVFEAPRGPAPAVFDDATVWVVDGAVYRRIVTPTVVWVQWDAPDRSYLLVGDLPPDHLEAVLTDLPEPGRRNLLVRLWRRLFG